MLKLFLFCRILLRRTGVHFGAKSLIFNGSRLLPSPYKLAKGVESDWVGFVPRVREKIL